MYVNSRTLQLPGAMGFGQAYICQACLAPRHTDQTRAGRGGLTLEGKLNGKAFANG